MLPNTALLHKLDLHIDGPIKKITLKDITVAKTTLGFVWLLKDGKPLLKLKHIGNGEVLVFSDGEPIGVVERSLERSEYPKLPNFINVLLGIKRPDQPAKV